MPEHDAGVRLTQCYHLMHVKMHSRKLSVSHVPVMILITNNSSGPLSQKVVQSQELMLNFDWGEERITRLQCYEWEIRKNPIRYRLASFFQDINTSGLVVRIQDIERERDRIYEAIDRGLYYKKNKVGFLI